MTTEEQIEVMQAYVDGKQIQFKSVCDTNWKDFTMDKISTESIWMWGVYDYRIKPESKYVPYDNTEEMIEDYCKRTGYIKQISDDLLPTIPIIWVMNGGCKKVIISFGDGSVKLIDGMNQINTWSMNDIFILCTYLDGSPVGKLVEE